MRLLALAGRLRPGWALDGGGMAGEKGEQACLQECPSQLTSAGLPPCSRSIDPERRIVLKDGTVLYGDPSLRGAGRKRK